MNFRTHRGSGLSVRTFTRTCGDRACSSGDLASCSSVALSSLPCEYVCARPRGRVSWCSVLEADRPFLLQKVHGRRTCTGPIRLLHFELEGGWARFRIVQLL